MNKKQWIVGVGITMLILGCDMSYDTLKKEYLSSNQKVESESKYGSVNGLNIKKEDILLAKNILNIQDDFDTLDATLKKEIINLIIEKKLLAQNSISMVSDNSLFKTKLRQAKEELALNMWIENETKKIEEKLKGSDIESFYKKNKELFLVPQQFKLRHIVLEEDKEVSKIIKTIKDSNNTLNTFISLAKSKSIDATSKIGGDLGWLGLDGLLPEVQELIKSMSSGDIVSLKKKTSLGFHIFYLEDLKKASYMKLESVKDDIKEILLKEKVDELMNSTVKKLKESAKIHISK